MKTGGKSWRSDFGPFSLPDRREVAYREAGQATVVTALGYRVRCVSLSWEPGGGIMVKSMSSAQWNDKEAAAISCAAGQAALSRRRLLDEHPCEDEAWFMYKSHWENDTPPILEGADDMPPETLAFHWRMMQRAVRLVELHWDQIDRLAQLLMRQGKVAGEEIEALLGDSLARRLN